MTKFMHEMNLAPRRSGAVVLCSAFLLSMIGLLVLFSISVVQYLKSGQSITSLWATRQAFWLAASAVVCGLCARIDYHILLKHCWKFLGLVWIGLCAALVIGDKQYGSRRWLELGPVNIQCSEVAKLVVILCCGRYVGVNKDRLSSYLTGFLPAVAWLGITFLLIAAAPDFGTSIFILATGMLLLHLGGLKLSHIVPTALVILPVYAWWMLSRNDYIRSRLASHADGGHEHVRTALRAIGNGGWEGLGLGGGRAQLGFLRMIHNDFIFAAVGEQCGVIGTLAIVVLFLLILWHGLKITMAAPDNSGFIVAFGITFVIVFQAAINMAVVTKLIPPKGIGLPFVSYGGSSLLIFGALLGVLTNVALQGRVAAGAVDEDLFTKVEPSAAGAGDGLLGLGSFSRQDANPDDPDMHPLGKRRGRT